MKTGLLIVDRGLPTWGRHSCLPSRPAAPRVVSSILNPQSSILNPRRSGFTLLEVILAISLSVVLIAALYAALRLHLTFAQRGPEQARKALLARAILDRIARDIRAVVPDAAVVGETSSSQTGTASAATGGSATSSASASTASEATTEPETDVYSEAFGILGGSDWIDVYAVSDRANLDDAELAAASGAVAQASNVVRVSYTLEQLTTLPDSRGRTDRYALMRSEVASIAAEQFDLSSSDADLRAAGTYLTDQIDSIEFQYWDDATATWLDSWGYDTPIAPPRAIRVRISLLEPEEYAEASLLGGASTWQPTYDLVIAIPTWEPEESSSSSTTGSTGSTTGGGS
jgi:prepilin-type N-terminal cleavage/methylation domain-containing protein